MKGKILYLQYTNPAALPPLEHSSRLLAARGWQVLFIGTGTQGSASLRFPPHPCITVRQMPFQPAGWRQKLHYLRYCIWSIYWVLRWRPNWIYISSPITAPSAFLICKLFRLHSVYHEHDGISTGSKPSSFMRLVLWVRRNLAHHVDICILPGQERIDWFAHEINLPHTSRVVCVWNCPTIDEVSPVRSFRDPQQLQVLFHGSIGPARLPSTILDALSMLPDGVHLKIVGYETIGSQGYLQYLSNLASVSGLTHRLHIVGAVPTRRELLEHCRQADVGLAFMPTNSSNVNEQTMFTGPSNKTFDYLASGLALLISDTPAWRRMYVDAGYGLTCNANDPDSIADALRWFLNNPSEMRTMGEKGRQRILAEWNYEQQFAAAIELLEAVL